MIHTIGVASLVSVLSAQFIKPFVELIKSREFSLLRMLDTGGMPSSHTSMVTTLTVGVAVYRGIDSVLFGISLVFSLYFIFEATGLRQEVGNQARVLNKIIEKASKTHHIDADELRELVGHTWGEVLGGLVLGLFIAALFFC